MGSRRRKRSFSTSPAWAFPSAREAHKIEGVGWDVAVAEAVKTESIPVGAGRVSVDKGRGGSRAATETCKRRDGQALTRNAGEIAESDDEAVEVDDIGGGELYDGAGC